MKLLLPNNETVSLPNTVILDERMTVVEELVRQFDNDLVEHGSSNRVQFFLNGLSNYLVWFKDEEDVNKEDKDIMSKEKMSKMKKYNPTSIPFTDVSVEEIKKYSIEDIEGDWD